MVRMLIAILLFLATVASLLGADAYKQPSVERLIEQLADRNFKVRQQAAQAIEALGPQALPALRKVKEHPDPEVRRRIEKWIPQFEAAELVAPKRVALKLINQPVAKALEELTRQTKYKLHYHAKDSRLQKACGFQLENLTFWEALDKICKEGRLTLAAQPGIAQLEEGLPLQFAERATPFVAYHQCFRVAVRGFSYQRSSSETKYFPLEKLAQEPAVAFEGNYNHTSEQFDLGLSIVAEPRLEILGIDTPLITEALDDQGRSVLPPKDENLDKMMRAQFRRNQLGPMIHMPVQCLSVGLPTSLRNAKSLKVIRGTIPVTLEKEKKALVVIDDINKAQGKTFEAGGLSVQIALFFKYPKGPDRYNLFLIMTRTQPGAADFGTDIDDEFELQDAKGNAYQSGMSSASYDGKTSERQFTYSSQFPIPLPNAPAVGPPAKLVYIKRTPLIYHVPFEFHDVPLSSP